MGNDGGSIPDRRDLVRTKPKAEQADRANQTRAKWFFCALSKRKLQEPVVSCALGKLYNKDAIIEFLLDRSTYGDGENICGHVRSLKDLKTLKLTTPKNNNNISSNNNSSGGGGEPADRAQFVCALTLKEMNGTQPFVRIATCGCVFSKAGLKAVTRSKKERGKDKEDTPSSSDSTEDVVELCPNCGTKYSSKEDVLPLNPSPEEEESLRLVMERKRAQEEPGATTTTKKKKSKKRKNDDDNNGLDEGEPTTKKKKRQERSTPASSSVGISGIISGTSRAVASELEKEEAKRKANMSSAVRSVYGSGVQRKETFMTRGTFTRYA